MNKDRIIFLLVGVIIGISLTTVGGKFTYKLIKKSSMALSLETKSIEPKKGIDFLKRLTPDGNISFESSEQNTTVGKKSLKVSITKGDGFPGLAWEVYGREVQNWKGFDDFHFDVYNNNENYVKLQVKFKSGRDYPKKTFSTQIELAPLKMNHIAIPLGNISGSCDIAQISYVKIFVSSPTRDIVLYFDNLGLGDVLQDEAIAGNKKAVVMQPKKTVAKRNLKKGYQVFSAASLDRIFQDGKTLLKPTFAEKAVITMARNEFESFQVVVTNGKDILKSVSLEFVDLVDAQTDQILNKGNLSWHTVGYIETKKPYYPVKYVGMWPDPLIPTGKIDIEAGITQPFWVTVYAPKDTKAGIYTGNITVLSEDKEIGNIPISVKVYDFTLPLQSHLKTAFDLYPHITPSRYPQQQGETGEEYKERISDLNEKFILNMLEHRMEPILNIDPLLQNNLNRVERYRAKGLSNFAIGKKGGTFNNNWPKTDKEIEKLLPLYRSYADSLKANKLLDYTYIYTWDEGKIGNPNVAKICSMIHRADPKLKNMVCYHGFWNPKKDPEWGKDIDIWCFQIDNFSEPKIKALKDVGIEIWVYVSGPSGSGSPNLAIDFDSIDYRIIPWLCRKYGIKGFLYWCVNWWPYINPFKSAANTKWEQNGNGLLYYPGENGPIDSLRTEIFRDGMEDYEYFYLLDERIKQFEANKPDSNYKTVLDKAKGLLNIDNSLVTSAFNYTKNPDLIYKRRGDIAESIEELDKILSGGSSSEQASTYSSYIQVTENFTRPIDAISGRSFGEHGQLTFELYRGGTFIIDGESGFALQRSDSYRDVSIIRSTKKLPKTYKLSVVVGDIDYDLNKLDDLQNDLDYKEGPLNENGTYLLAITDETPIGHHTNDWWHQHRKVCIDVDNNVWGHGMPNPIFTVFFDKNNNLWSLNGKKKEWQEKWERAIQYESNAWYKVEIEKNENSYILKVFDINGILLKGGVIPFKYVWHSEDGYPDYFVIGDPHENYYQGSMKIKSISMPVEFK